MGNCRHDIKTKGDKKIMVDKLAATGKYSVTDIARKVQITRNTARAWMQKRLAQVKELPTKSKILQINRNTARAWMQKRLARVKELPTKSKILLWQSESVEDVYLSALARDSLKEMLLTEKERLRTGEIKPGGRHPHQRPISPDTKRAIMHSASATAGIKWDKSRLEAGQATEIHEVFAMSAREEQELREFGRGVLRVMRERMIEGGAVDATAVDVTEPEPVIDTESESESEIEE